MTVIELARVDSRILVWIDGAISVYCEHTATTLMHQVPCDLESLTRAVALLARGSVDENV